MSEEEKSHYEAIRAIIKEEVSPINRNVNYFITIAIGCFGFMFFIQMNLTKDVEAKANDTEVRRDYLQKLEYYQLEDDEHRILQEFSSNPEKAAIAREKINANNEKELGFKLTTRGK